ncbi:stage V sporulation T C-terminal domain-containing protein [Candidatus Avoscillospira sp. LCP25S3_F1]|uniref:stage V sporulation T C-terminal domain-containing protein n=1 Tax=Candidatus Avoscillospira sp. LCP25S3_F1 TaxID=3438825 RepID=UPI003F8FEA6E
MIETFDIAGYCRISVDDELDRDNVSIENQKAIIQDFVKQKFPGSTLTFYEDRDRSGYTFEQREGYQTMRNGLMAHQYDILIIKDFSRFSRRNSRGLVELEDLRDAGVRIISIGDGIDFPNDDDWLKIQFQFLINEMPVTDTSKKVRNVIKRRQADGKWICAAPYGYLINQRQEFEIVPTEADIVRTIFRLYNEEGWGYKKIANYLTEQGIPTPRMAERDRKEAAGAEYRRTVKSSWAIVTVQGILDNDFYIGTLRQSKYTRKKINGKDVRQDEAEQIVIERHHQPILDYRTFATTRALREKRSTSNYRGIKKYDNVYSGFLTCGDCGAPMFAMSRSDLKPAYTCGTYHRRGRAGCTSHHIRVDKLDELLKLYIRRVMDHSADMLERLNQDLEREQEDVVETEQSADHLASVLAELQEELKVTKRQRIRDLMKHPEQEALLEETYDELESDLQKKIEGISHQIELLADKRNTIIQVNRAARTALEVFEDILKKDHLERNDLELIIDHIKIYEDHLEIQLQADVDAILQSAAQEEAVNFKSGIENIVSCRIVQSATHQKDKVFDVHVISDGDPLEIYTEKDGEVIFKKYSPMGDLSDFAGQLCESIYKNTGHLAAISDRDTVIALSGGHRRELGDKRVSNALEQLMEQRKSYRYAPGVQPVPVVDGSDHHTVGVAAPILAEGDVLGSVVLVTQADEPPLSEDDQKLAQTIATFLGRQMES